MGFTTINPATGEASGTFETVSIDESLRYAKASSDAFAHWEALGVDERADHLRRLASSLRSKKREYAELITMEMGKPIRQSIGEIEKCAWLAEVYAESGRSWLEDEFFSTDAQISKVVYEPLGVVLSIMPWNFPFWQALRFAVPTILAGNTTILRHSRVVPRCASALEDAFRYADFPENIFKAIVTDHDAVEALIASDHINAVSFTGSVASGSRIAQLAGGHIKKVVLELGGSDPFIVLEGANIEKAAESAAEARLINSGQSCVAAKRFLVVESVAEEFVEKFIASLEKAKVGDPMRMETDVGPLVRMDHLELLEKQLSDAVERGGKILTGGERLRQDGYFFPPTAVGDARVEMRLMKEEVFGPVAPIATLADEDEILSTANGSELGLAASVWTSDIDRASRLSKRLDVGVVFVNGIVKSDPRMPFGGVKKSGFGRELSKYGLKEFVNVKGINIYQSR